MACQRCFEAFSHHEVSEHEVKAPQSAGRAEAGYGGKVCLQFCKDASLTVLTVIGGGGVGGTHPDQPEGSSMRQRSAVEDGKGLLELGVLAGAVREECLVCRGSASRALPAECALWH